jgi:TolB-like protein/Tfp pilus assembly protein PilF
MIYRFDEFKLDLDKFELRCAGQPRHVEPMVFDLIRYLSENAGRVVSRDEIIEGVWDGRIVSDATISSCIKSARKALDDSGDNQSYIRTVRGRGFQFAGEVARNGAAPAKGEPDAQPEPVPTPVVSGNTTLALLPFDVFSPESGLQYFADGLVEDLTTILARVPALTVISRSSSFSYKGKSPSVAQVRDELGVSHLIEGSVRSLGDQARINVQLIDTSDGGHVWAERFDRPFDELMKVQDDIIQAISRVLEPQLVRVSYIRGQYLQPEEDAAAAFNQANGLLAIKGWHQDSFTEAARLLERCIEIQPDFARAHAFLSLILGLGQRLGLLYERERAIEESLAATERALALDDVDSTVLGFTGCAMADIGLAQRGIPLLEKALEQDPSNAQAWAALGAAKLADKRPEEAAEDLREGIRLSPLDNRLAIWMNFLATALLYSGDTDGAVEEIAKACRQDTRNFMPRVTKAAILLSARRTDEAKSAMAEAYSIRPELSEDEIGAIVGEKICRVMGKLGLLTT